MTSNEGYVVMITSDYVQAYGKYNTCLASFMDALWVLDTRPS